jgi:acetyl-CoA carboxylase/biotin carboxylase 1
MEAKGCAKPLVWKNARRHFYWSLRARLAKESVLRALEDANPLATYEDRLKVLPTLVSETNDPQQLAQEFESIDLASLLPQLRHQYAVTQVQRMAEKDRASTIQGFTHLIQVMSAEEKAALTVALQAASVRSAGKWRLPTARIQWLTIL